MTSNNSSPSSITKYGKVLPILGLIYFIGAIALDYLHKESLSIPQGADLVNNGLKKQSQKNRASSSSEESDSSQLFDYTQSGQITNLDSSMDAIKERLQPRRLQIQEQNAISHQILHLHNMKTAGTSIDKRLNCAIKRMGQDYNVTIPRYSTFWKYGL